MYAPNWQWFQAPTRSLELCLPKAAARMPQTAAQAI
jgi:hypothetical protein